MSTLREEYQKLIDEFKLQNEQGRGEVNFAAIANDNTFTMIDKTEQDKSLLSHYYTKTEGDETLKVHIRCYDRCRAFQVLPDGNRLTVSFQSSGSFQDQQFSWEDER